MVVIFILFILCYGIVLMCHNARQFEPFFQWILYAVSFSKNYETLNLKKMEQYTKEQLIEFANAVAYNHDYKGKGKWTKKEWDDESLVDVREYTTDELLTIFLKQKAKDEL